jgi:hypothetical protein
MKLVLHVPDRIEYTFDLQQKPEVLRPGDTVHFTFRVLVPDTHQPVTRFELVHEKFMHLFLVSQDLEFFAHVHPDPQPDGSFKLSTVLPRPGMYRLLADFYPAQSVPQLAVNTVFVAGKGQVPNLRASLEPCHGTNLTAALRTEPEALLAGLEARLFLTIDPAAGFERYLGAWGHMLAASEDLIDLIHLHPFLADGGPTTQFNVIFPRAGLYRVWTQFQRLGVVNTVTFTVPVKNL